MNISKRMGDIFVKIYDSAPARALLTTPWYSLMSRLDKEGEVKLLNYGYSYSNDKKIKLQPDDEKNRYPLQLYDYVAKGKSLKKKIVLEVGCGRGGGTSYIARYMTPKRIIGLDICKPAIEFSKKKYSEQNNISFEVGDAQNLPFKNSTFDVVINIESSHHYPDMKRFLSEVLRVLKPGGYFLMACYRMKEKLPSFEKDLASSKFKLIKREEITNNVIKALEIDSERRRELINKLSPRILRRLTTEFSGTPGTDLYKSFTSGELPYFNLIYQKKSA